MPSEGWHEGLAFRSLLATVMNVAITNNLDLEGWQAASLLQRHFAPFLTEYNQREVRCCEERSC